MILRFLRQEARCEALLLQIFLLIMPHCVGGAIFHLPAYLNHNISKLQFSGAPEDFEKVAISHQMS